MSKEQVNFTEHNYDPLNSAIEESIRTQRAKSSWVFAKVFALVLVSIGILALLLAWAYNIYKRPNPNTYLAKFGRFVIDNKELPYFKKLIRKGFNLFISNQIEQFSDCREVPLHFIGSIGFYLKDELSEILESKKMIIGKVLRKPIDGLVNYHLENI